MHASGPFEYCLPITNSKFENNYMSIGKKICQNGISTVSDGTYILDARIFIPALFPIVAISSGLSRSSETLREVCRIAARSMAVTEEKLLALPAALVSRVIVWTLKTPRQQIWVSLCMASTVKDSVSCE
ncbi:hypothetical protein RvY_10931 [Ramazzottius varieornatus]|uniref:Uncharacterized protein n=1 Tax=Ramazzottius varieornatus TaxID=947166 RepID=A0A1D1VEE5_RAMVA|nr:hypothetical protein RvY_10931 [Ramazzottius varieornatus]